MKSLVDFHSSSKHDRQQHLLRSLLPPPNDVTIRVPPLAPSPPYCHAICAAKPIDSAHAKSKFGDVIWNSKRLVSSASRPNAQEVPRLRM